MTQIFNGIGYVILWFIGMFVIPLFVAVFPIFLGYSNEDLADISFWIALVIFIYWILTSIILIKL